MCVADAFKIDLHSLKEGRQALHFDLDDTFFGALEDAEIRRGNVGVDMTIDRTGNVFDIHAHLEGAVVVPCDLCLDDMSQPINTDERFIATLGEAPATEEDDLITVAEDEGILDIAWHLYETVALAVPVRHVHEPGKCNAAMTAMLQKHSTARSSEETGGQAVDSRWAALKNIKIE